MTLQFVCNVGLQILPEKHVAIKYISKNLKIFFVLAVIVLLNNTVNSRIKRMIIDNIYNIYIM